MNTYHSIFVLILVIFSTVFITGCTEQKSHQNIVNSDSLGCSQYQRSDSLYTVVKGEPFTYTGLNPNPDIQFIQVDVQSPLLDFPLVSESVPVNPDGTFTFSLNGNWTENWGDLLLIGANGSPYHVLLNFTTAEKDFNLIIVQSPADIQCIQNSTWIHITPRRRVQVSSELRNVIGDLVIDGITNLPPGDEITLMVFSPSTGMCQKGTPDNIINHCSGALEHKVKVQKSSCGANTWSFTINTSYYRFTDYQYAVYVSAVNKSQNNCGSWDTTSFMIELDKTQTWKGGPTPMRMDPAITTPQTTRSLVPFNTVVR
jgi:hypothetical protein